MGSWSYCTWLREKPVTKVRRRVRITPEDVRSEIPALSDVVYLNWGASGPSPQRVVEAVEEGLEDHEYRGHAGDPYETAYEVYDDAREAVASLLSTEPEKVALTSNTTEGINLVAGCLDWQEGDTVVSTELEHSSGQLPWKLLRDRRGVELGVVGERGGRLDFDELKDAVRGARLVCVSSLAWMHGTRVDVERAVDVAHDAGAEVLVDAAQSVGQMEVDVEAWGADYVAGTGHKWLLGPWGAGFLYVRGERTPDRIGYRGVEDADADDFEWKMGAGRFEVAAESPGVFAGLREAVEVFEEVGVEVVERRIEELTGRLKEKVDAELMGPGEYESGLVPLGVEDPEATVERLMEHDLKLRVVPRPGCVRVSVHAYNSAEDIDALTTYL